VRWSSPQRSKVESRSERKETRRVALRQIVAFSSYASQAIGEHQGMQACGPSPTEFLQQWRPFPVVTDDPTNSVRPKRCANVVAALAVIIVRRGSICPASLCNIGRANRSAPTVSVNAVTIGVPEARRQIAQS
jgi:hypothetical protein